MGGVDIGGGGLITSVVSGTVVEVVSNWNPPVKLGTNSEKGNYIVVMGMDGREYIYEHLGNVLPKISKGDFVSSGETLGEMGNTGKSTGTHLHFEVREAPYKRGNAVGYSEELLSKQGETLCASCTMPNCSLKS